MESEENTPYTFEATTITANTSYADYIDDSYHNEIRSALDALAEAEANRRLEAEFPALAAARAQYEAIKLLVTEGKL